MAIFHIVETPGMLCETLNSAVLEQNNESYPLSFQVDTWRPYHSYLEVKKKRKITMYIKQYLCFKTMIFKHWK